MSILINKDTKVITQGITGATGLFHAQGARGYGTQMVGGVTPGKGGTCIDGFPVFDTVREAVHQTGASARPAALMKPAPSTRAVQPETAMPGGSFRPTAWPTRPRKSYGP